MMGPAGVMGSPGRGGGGDKDDMLLNEISRFVNCKIEKLKFQILLLWK
jgi:hypothetical protein